MALLGYDVSAAEAGRDARRVRWTLRRDPRRRAPAAGGFADLRAVSRAHGDLMPAARSSTCMRSCARSTPPPRVCPTASWPVSSARCATTGSTAWSAPPALEEACYRLFLSRQRAPTARRAVRAILERRLEQAGDARPARTASCRACSTGWRPRSDGPSRVWPISRARCGGACFDQPLIEEGRQDIYGAADADIDALAARPDDAASGARLAPWSTARSRWRPAWSGGSTTRAGLREQLLEAMTRRYYRDGPARGRGASSRPAASASPRPRSSTADAAPVAAAFAATEELQPTLRALGDVAGTLSEDERLLADLYAWRTDSPRGSRRAVGAVRRAAGGRPAPGVRSSA